MPLQKNGWGKVLRSVTFPRLKTDVEKFGSCLPLLAVEESTAAFFDTLGYDQADIENAHRPNREAEQGSPIEPFTQCPPKRGKRYVYIWHCCACGKAGIGIMIESCPDCGIGRCPVCRTEKVRVQSTMRPESRDVDAADVDTENSIGKILEYHRNEAS
ncbi:hypothetical protein NA56DRAFT_491943 [Hyaloscypha hepaticicola]|uniref:Uncharacterized protein n=1 Tax=Hyaloscypha hepaticicola TaxID=2082293 RepID=A0A2J6QEA2_9HELO|nr:hypothetical protein NA56DRAFT_491943 [Hyaloscypha hepaticicola]